eukprot:2956189-Rhodomonas_salina.1
MSAYAAARPSTNYVSATGARTNCCVFTTSRCTTSVCSLPSSATSSPSSSRYALISAYAPDTASLVLPSACGTKTRYLLLILSATLSSATCQLSISNSPPILSATVTPFFPPTPPGVERAAAGGFEVEA